MNATTRFVSGLLLAAITLLSACGTITPTQGNVYRPYTGGYTSLGTVSRWPDGYHWRGDDCYHGPARMSQRSLCEGQAGATTVAGQLAGFQGVETPQRALTLVMEMDGSPDNPCRGRSANWETFVNSVAGGVGTGIIGAATARRGERSEKALEGFALGGVVGAAKGRGDAVVSCEAWSAERRRLLTIVYAGESRCAETLQQVVTNGVMNTVQKKSCSVLEGKDFQRIGQ